MNADWELETEQATAQQTAAGSWQVTLDVRARKAVVDEAGVETEVSMDDWVARATAKNPVDPFIDPEGYRAYIDAAEAEFRKGVVH